MTLLTQATDVFAAAETGGRSVVVFLARRQPGTAAIFGPREREAVEAALRELRAEGWRLSVRAMFDPEDAVPTAFDTGFAHGIDIAGAFEAPSLSAALAGTRRLEQAGWSRRFATEWLIGPREFATVGGLDPTPGASGASWRSGSGTTPGAPRAPRRGGSTTPSATWPSRAI